MRRIILSQQNQAQAEQAKRKRQARSSHPRSMGIEMKCFKCGKKLKVGDMAYRTTRKYLCKECGEKAEI